MFVTVKKQPAIEIAVLAIHPVTKPDIAPVIAPNAPNHRLPLSRCSSAIVSGAGKPNDNPCWKK